MVCSIAVFPLIAWISERVEIVDNRYNSFSTDDVDNSLILSHIVFHLFLNVSIMLEDVLQMFLAKNEVLLESSILVYKILIYSSYFSTFLLYLV